MILLFMAFRAKGEEKSQAFCDCLLGLMGIMFIRIGGNDLEWRHFSYLS